MSTLVDTSLAGAVPVAFVTVESLLIVAAGLAAVGAALTAVLGYRAHRERGQRKDPARRRVPSPSSLGMADDPIVAAIEAAARDRARRRRVHHADRIEP